MAEPLKYGHPFKHFGNIIELLEYIEQNEKRRDWGVIDNNRSARNWTGGYSYRQAKEQIITGETKYTQKFIEGLKTVQNEDTDNTQFGFDVEGDSYDMGAVVEGIPECCIQQTFPQDKKYIRVIAALGFRDGTPEQAIVNRGVAITHLISTLLTQGYIVDFSVCMYCSQKFSKQYGGFVLDLPRNMISISSIAFVCSIQFFRIISLLTCDMINDVNWAGHCQAYKPDEFLDWARKDTLYIDDDYDYDFEKDVRDYCKTPELAMAYVKEKYNNFCENNVKK